MTPVRIFVSHDGPYALVSWEAGEVGGTDLVHQHAAAWCRIMHGGGIIGESDIRVVDGIDRARAPRLFSAKPDAETVDATR